MSQYPLETKKENKEELITMEKRTKRKIYFWIVLSFFCILISLFLIFLILFFLKQAKVNKVFNSKELKEEIGLEENINKKVRLIDGVYVEEGRENFFPFAVMIDNHSDARPPSGLDRANLVFEAEVEGGITRYLAIFASGENIPEIGPIRSARPYFINWAHEFSALYAHVGGSPEALVKIKQDNIFDINEFYNETYFWRADHFNMPHNVFTSSEKLKKYIQNKNLEEGSFFPWKFKNDKKKKDLPLSSKISIKFKLDIYAVDWIFDQENNIYIRYQNTKCPEGVKCSEDKKPHYVKSGGIISAKNIIIEYVPAEEIDDKLRLNMKVVGEGEALVCLDGSCREAQWEKKTESSRTRYYINDEEIEFNRGVTWIEVLRPEIEINYE